MTGLLEKKYKNVVRLNFYLAFIFMYISHCLSFKSCMEFCTCHCNFFMYVNICTFCNWIYETKGCHVQRLHVEIFSLHSMYILLLLFYVSEYLFFKKCSKYV